MTKKKKPPRFEYTGPSRATRFNDVPLEKGDVVDGDSSLADHAWFEPATASKPAPEPTENEEG